MDAKKGNRQSAIKFYRAAIYGTWEGDGAERRKDVRLELARYLLSQRDYSGARTELLIAGGNDPEDTALAMSVAGMLEDANDPTDALSFYQKVVQAEPKNEQALTAAGRMEFAAGKFKDAHQLLERAARVHDDSVPEPAEFTDLLENSERILLLAPVKSLPARARVERIQAARRIARKRFDDCMAKAPGAGPLMLLTTEWASSSAKSTTQDLMGDTDTQDAAMKLVFDTEIGTSEVCGTPTGDDALLLQLAKSPGALED
jgi:tetratricopeptide (TPR) repeat protein